MATRDEIVRDVLEQASGDVRAARQALEDGAYLADAGYTDADTEAVEEAHALLRNAEVRN